MVLKNHCPLSQAGKAPEPLCPVHATIAFDAVAGEMTGKIFNAMPPGSTILVYGVLSYTPCKGIDGGDLIFGLKRIQGFWLTDWVRKGGFLRTFRATGQIQKLIAEGSIVTRVHRRLKLENVPEGLMAYQKQMTAGKILIIPR
jgi:NADPH:quinone reductase-like Zn-dependent oxidoreductase